MLVNHFKVAYRHLRRNKSFAFINIAGLSVGMTAFFLITQYVSFQLSFDRFHANAEHIYRVGLRHYSNGTLIETSASTFPGIRGLLKEHFPEVKNVTGFFKTPANTGFLFRYKGKIYNESGGWLNSDSSFFNVFPSLLLRGDATTALREPNSLVISETLAKKLFGDQDPVGQVLDRIDDYADGANYTVRAVLRDIPANAHFHASIIEHIHDSWPEAEVKLWAEDRLYTYVTFSEEIQPGVIEAKLNALLKQLQHENIIVKDTEVFLQPIQDIYLSSDCKDELEQNGSKALLYLLATIGLVILITGWINYINLETSRFLLRVKEYGIRRVVGSGKLNLVIQYLTEYCCLIFAAIALSAACIGCLLPYYTDLTGAPVNEIQWMHGEFLSISTALFLAGTLLTGMYPAFFLMRFNPALAIKGKVGKSATGARLRQSLIVFQFASSIILIAFVMAVDQQTGFMKVIDKGVELETIIAIRNPTAYSNQELSSRHDEFQTFENSLLRYAAIKSVSSSSAIPGSEIGFSYVNLIKRNLDDPYDPTIYKTLFVSGGFLSTYDLELLAGKTFSIPANFNGNTPWETTNWASVILNESAIHQLGFGSAGEAVDKEVYFQAFNDFIKCRIVGVLRDYHHEAAKKKIYPTILFHNYSTFQQVYFSVRLNGGSKPQEALSHIENTWREIFPDRPFEYFFLDEYYDRQFRSEVQFQRIFTLFASIAIVIACLGILGITLFEMNSRLKEISVRKILGASVAGVILLLTRLNFRLVLIASLIAGPLIFYLTREWLSGYPQRIEFKLSWIGVPVMIVLTTVILVSTIQITKAATANPVEHLKNE